MNKQIDTIRFSLTITNYFSLSKTSKKKLVFIRPVENILITIITVVV